VSDTLREEPRSWVAVVREAIVAHAATLWLAVFLLCSGLAVLATATALHINGITIAALAAAEAQGGKPLAESVEPLGLAVGWTFYTLTALASLHQYLDAR